MDLPILTKWPLSLLKLQKAPLHEALFFIPLKNTKENQGRDNQGQSLLRAVILLSPILESFKVHLKTDMLLRFAGYLTNVPLARLDTIK